MAVGNQKNFNWDQLAASAITGGIAGGFGLLSKAANVADAIGKAVAVNSIGQGVNIAMGQQKKFDWTGLAVAGVMGGMSYGVGNLDAVTKLGAGGQVLTGTASALAGAATKSLLTRQSFGQSLRETLPGAIASTIGNIVGGQIVKAMDAGKTAGAATEVSNRSDTDLRQSSNARLPNAWPGTEIDTSKYAYLSKLGFDSGSSTLDMSAPPPSFDPGALRVKLAADSQAFARSPKVDYSAAQNPNFHDPKYKHIIEVQVGDAEVRVNPLTKEQYAAVTGLTPPKMYLISENVSTFSIKPSVADGKINWTLTDRIASKSVTIENISYSADSRKEYQLDDHFGKLVFVPQYNAGADRFLSAAYSGVGDFEFGLVGGLKQIGEHPLETLRGLGELAGKWQDPTGLGKMEISAGIAQSMIQGAGNLYSGYQSAARTHTLPEFMGRLTGQALPNFIPGPGGALRGAGSSTLRRTAAESGALNQAGGVGRSLYPRTGVIITDRAVNFGDVYKLGTQNGRTVEFALTSETTANGVLVKKLYSGGQWSVGVPSDARLIGHVHPNDIPGKMWPSTADMNGLNDQFFRELQVNPTATPKPSRVFWGPGNADNTVFYPGFNKGPVMPGRKF
jgi:hypothetical protein